MQGIVLGFDTNEKQGVIIANDERYKFCQNDWKEQKPPQKGLRVDFVAEENGAKEIYLVASEPADTTILALISLAITFLLGFIGTLISRIVISKHDFSQALMPTLAHFIITILAFIPILGWIIYVVGTVYFMVKNYQYVLNPQGVNKYE
jgi:uncharacterized membrane protein